MESFAYYRGLFGHFYEAVKKGHAESPRKHRGHGLDHDVTVAQLAVRIAPDEQTAGKAWVAAMLHSLDRTVKEECVASTARKYLAFLPAGYYTPREVEVILQAALRHSEKNRDDQTLTQQVLMDADRLANLQPTVIIRSGQFQPEIPPVEFDHLSSNNPASTYHRPMSVLDDLRNNIHEYVPQLRMPKARALGAQYAEQLKAFVDSVEHIHRELGLAGVKL